MATHCRRTIPLKWQFAISSVYLIASILATTLLCQGKPEHASREEGLAPILHGLNDS